MLAILRGDDTDFQELRTIYVTLKEFPFSLVGCTGRFVLCGQTVNIPQLAENTEVAIKFTSAQTGSMPLGIQNGKFCVIDANAKIRTYDSSIRVLVSDSAEDVYGIVQGGNGVTVYGSVDYNSLKNKPKIGGHEVVGNKTYGDMGLVARINDDYAPNANGNVRIPHTFIDEEPPNTSATYEEVPTGYLVEDKIFAKSNNKQYIMSQLADGTYKWIEITGGLSSVNWSDIGQKPYQGQTVTIRTDDDVYSVLAAIVGHLGGTVNA